MLSFSHILNPFIAPPNSDLAIAQPIVFESMRQAKRKAEGSAIVNLLAVQFPEDEIQKPEGFISLPFLQEEVSHHGKFSHPLRLPLIREILDRAYEFSNADYLIYTNADIILHPDFYLRIKIFAEEGHDAFIINRRRIPPRWNHPKQLPEITRQKGKSHPGFDCFVFRRELFSRFVLENICIGVPFIEISLSQNLFAFSKKFRLYEKEFLTFHLGMEIFRRRAPEEYLRYNRNEYRKLKEKLRPFLHPSKLPYADLPLPLRLIRQGLHPCIPIKEVLRLEWDALVQSEKDKQS